MSSAPGAAPERELAVVAVDVLRQPELGSDEALLVLVLAGRAALTASAG